MYTSSSSVSVFYSLWLKILSLVAISRNSTQNPYLGWKNQRHLPLLCHKVIQLLCFAHLPEGPALFFAGSGYYTACRCSYQAQTAHIRWLPASQPANQPRPLILQLILTLEKWRKKPVQPLKKKKWRKKVTIHWIENRDINKHKLQNDMKCSAANPREASCVVGE